MYQLNIWQRMQEYAFAQILLGIVLLVTIILLSFASPHFLTWDNWRNILDQSALQVLIAVGMTFVICTGGILRNLPPTMSIYFMTFRDILMMR